MALSRTDQAQDNTGANKKNVVYRNDPHDYPAYSPLSLKYSNNLNPYQNSALSPIVQSYIPRSPHMETMSGRPISQQASDMQQGLGGLKQTNTYQEPNVHQPRLISKGRSPSISGIIPLGGDYESVINAQKLSTLKIDTSNRTTNYAFSPNLHQIAPQTTMGATSKASANKNSVFLTGSVTTKNARGGVGVYDIPVDAKSQLFQSPQPQTQMNMNNMGSPLIDINKDILPNHEPTKCSSKRNGIVKAYAANTNQGIVRNYNEDRVSIILNIMKPSNRTDEGWPKCSFFGVYDGHGGVACADYLRDNLHQFVIKDNSFPWNPKEAIKSGFAAAEKSFLEAAQNQPNGEIERSGSCAIVVLIVGDMCYIANVGDSRAVMSGDSGNRIYHLSRDHKPSDELEYKRITEAGGKVYQTQAPVMPAQPGVPNQYVLGPMRVFPGRLSVSRTFGDIEAKLEKLNGNSNVVIAEPEIKSFKILQEHDFIVLASDGIYDKLSSKEAIQCVWDCIQGFKSENIHEQCGLGVESILRESINRKTVDNITVVMIAFKNFKNKLKEFRVNNGTYRSTENVLRDKMNEIPLSNDDARKSPDLVAAHKKSGYYSAELGNKQEGYSYLQRSSENMPRNAKPAENKKAMNIHRSLDQENLYHIVQQQKKSALVPGTSETNNYSYLNNGTSTNGGMVKNYSGGLHGIGPSQQTVGYSGYVSSQYGTARPASSNKLNLIDQKLSELSNKLQQTLFKE